MSAFNKLARRWPTGGTTGSGGGDIPATLAGLTGALKGDWWKAATSKQ